MGVKPPSTTGSAILDEPSSELLPPPDRALPFEESVRTVSSALPPEVFYVLCAAGYVCCIVLLLIASSFHGDTASAVRLLAGVGILANLGLGLMRARSARH